MPENSERRLVAEVKMLRTRLAQCERAMTRQKQAEEAAHAEILKLRASLAKLRKQHSSVRKQSLSRSHWPENRDIGNTESVPPSKPVDLAWGSQNTWVNIIAHELRQPLTAIVNYTRASSLLVESGKADTSELLEALNQAALQAERAGEMIRQLRRVAVPGLMQISAVQLPNLCREVLTILEKDLQLAHIEVDLQIPDTLPKVRADAFQIRLVFLNLFRNAIEAMAKSKKRQLRIIAQQQATDVEVAISDTGQGLSPDMVHSLFEPYQTTKPQGMGLGLALCRAIVQAHGGRIWANVHSPRGTTFSFTLPNHSSQ